MPSPLREQNSETISALDRVGWTIYLSGLFASFFWDKTIFTLLSAFGLILILMKYFISPQQDLLSLQINRHNRLHWALMLGSILCLITKLNALATFFLGAAFFLFGCLSLKHRIIYLGGRLTIEQGAAYRRESKPIIYWLSTTFFILFGFLLLIGIQWKRD